MPSATYVLKHAELDCLTIPMLKDICRKVKIETANKCKEVLVENTLQHEPGETPDPTSVLKAKARQGNYHDDDEDEEDAVRLRKKPRKALRTIPSQFTSVRPSKDKNAAGSGESNVIEPFHQHQQSEHIAVDLVISVCRKSGTSGISRATTRDKLTERANLLSWCYLNNHHKMWECTCSPRKIEIAMIARSNSNFATSENRDIKQLRDALYKAVDKNVTVCFVDVDGLTTNLLGLYALLRNSKALSVKLWGMFNTTIYHGFDGKLLVEAIVGFQNGVVNEGLSEHMFVKWVMQVGLQNFRIQEAQQMIKSILNKGYGNAVLMDPSKARDGTI